MMLFRWFLTVFSLMRSAAAISLLTAPRVSSSRTSHSRGLMLPAGAAASPPPPPPPPPRGRRVPRRRRRSLRRRGGGRPRPCGRARGHPPRARASASRRPPRGLGGGKLDLHPGALAGPGADRELPADRVGALRHHLEAEAAGGAAPPP